MSRIDAILATSGQKAVDSCQQKYIDTSMMDAREKKARDGRFTIPHYLPSHLPSLPYYLRPFVPFVSPTPTQLLTYKLRASPRLQPALHLFTCHIRSIHGCLVPASTTRPRLSSFIRFWFPSWHRNPFIGTPSPRRLNKKATTMQLQLPSCADAASLRISMHMDCR